jgi:hypothetical protein
MGHAKVALYVRLTWQEIRCDLRPRKVRQTDFGERRRLFQDHDA